MNNYAKSWDGPEPEDSDEEQAPKVNVWQIIYDAAADEGTILHDDTVTAIADAMMAALSASRSVPPALVGTIDARCSCDSCEARTGNIYRMIGTCNNCGAKPFLILYRAGDSASPQNCPTCGRYSTVRAERLATPDEIPAPPDGKDQP